MEKTHDNLSSIFFFVFLLFFYLWLSAGEARELGGGGRDVQNSSHARTGTIPDDRRRDFRDYNTRTLGG